VNFRSTRITAVNCNVGAHTARIQGEGINNGNLDTFTVDVIDNGEAGTADVFQIMLGSGYSRSGTLSRGNIQVHE
jgi:hypothetical protein